MSNVIDLPVTDGEHIISQINDCIYYTTVEEECGTLFVPFIEKNATLTDLDKQYDLQKFFESLNDEDMDWVTEKTATGEMSVSFSVSIPEEYWDDPMIYEECIYGVDDVEVGNTDAEIYTIYTECRGTICIGPAVLKKLQNSRREVVL